MSLKERISHFWNVTLGVDIPEQEDIETSSNPELAELKESLERVKALEEKATSKHNNGGKKGGKGKSKVVETVTIDPREVLKVSEMKKENASKDMER